MSSNSSYRRVLVLVLPQMHALDFAGPVQCSAVQCIHETNGFLNSYDLKYVSTEKHVCSAEGFVVSQLEPLPNLQASDWVLVPGTESTQLDVLQAPNDWLRAAVETGCRVSSICTGAFVLARAGLLRGRKCTTHWRLLSKLGRSAPEAEVLDDRLFVTDRGVTTSAGVASGIDMALAAIEEDCGARVAAKVAREMVVYLRRSSESEQTSVYLDFRSHTHPAVHRVQDWILAHPEQRRTQAELAEIALLSPRHLSRVFRKATGTTLKGYSNRVKLEVARDLFRESQLTPEEVAERCGFDSPRQLRRLWKSQFGGTVRESLSNSVSGSPVH